MTRLITTSPPNDPSLTLLASSSCAVRSARLMALLSPFMLCGSGVGEQIKEHMKEHMKKDMKEHFRKHVQGYMKEHMKQHIKKQMHEHEQVQERRYLGENLKAHAATPPPSMATPPTATAAMLNKRIFTFTNSKTATLLKFLK